MYKGPRTIVFLEGGGGGENIDEKNVLGHEKTKEIVWKHDMRKKMFAETSDKLWINISSKTEINIKSNKFY